MLGKDLQQLIDHEIEIAQEKRHRYITVEHLLLALLGDTSVQHVVEASQVDVLTLKKLLTDFVDTKVPRLAISSDQTEFTAGFKRVMQRAPIRVQMTGRNEVHGADFLLAIYEEKTSFAVECLTKAGLEEEILRNYIDPGAAQKKRAGASQADIQTMEQMDAGMEEQSGGAQDGMSAFAKNLNQKAKQDRIEPLIGRENEINEVIRVLCRRQKNNPILIGEPGVGKTAIAEGLARKIVNKEVPRALENSTIYALDLASLIAGTQFRGEFEKRLKMVLDEVEQNPDSILFIDEIHMIVGAGSTGGNAMDIANIIKPKLTSGELSCIGATTYDEYRKIFQKDKALSRRFQEVDVPEPTIPETTTILKGLRSRFEKHHGVKYTNEALQVAAELSDRYINDRFLPDKAIDVMDEAGATHHLLPANQRTGIVDVAQVEKIVAKIAHIPPKSITQSDKEKLKNLDKELRSVVFGQDQAIDVLVAAIKLARSGLREGSKPVGSFLFSGPTGVGKTEVTKQLANILGIKLLRFDMSEYMEPHSVSRLIGAPAGYVGHGEGGLLTESVTKHPHCIVLLDEIEKAHKDIYNILLQAMDNGKITDSNGRPTDFRHALIVMTTNAGASEMQKASIGFTTPGHEDAASEEINRVFSPEFRNRLDAVIQFKVLEVETIANVVNKFINELADQLKLKHVELVVDEDARLWLAENGYDVYMGARAMARLIQERVKKPLADELLFGSLSDGGRVTVSLKDGELSFQIQAIAKA